MEITPAIKPDFIAIEDEATVAELIGKMTQYEKHAALVFRNKKYLGLIEKKRLLRSRLDPSETHLKKYLQKTPIINEHASVIESAYLMFQSDADFLPVERNKQIIGVLDGLALAKLAISLPEIKHLTVADIKLVKPSKIGKDEPITRAMEVMHDEHLDHVPIYDQGKLYGLLSYKDLLRRYLNWTPKRDYSVRYNKAVSGKGGEGDIPSLSALPVSSFSTNDNLLVVTKGARLRDSVELMVRNNVHDLVLKDGEAVLGLLTVKNLLRRIGSLKIPQNFNIQFIGLNQLDLDPGEKENVQKIASNESMKLQRKIHNEFTLVIHFKEYATEGKQQKQHKYSVHLRIEYPGKIVTVSQDDWDIIRALRETFANAENALDKKFKGDEHVPRARR